MMPRADRERGASLLSVLVIVMLMSAAAVAATDALARSVAIAKSSGARAETFWTARGAADAAASYLVKIYDATGGRFNEKSDLFAQRTTLPAGHGLVALSVREASNCFNLNALLDDSSDSAVGEGELTAYRNLLTASGVNEAEARSLAEKLADWIDADTSTRTYGAEDAYYASLADPYRTAGVPLRNISELNAVAGYDLDIIARLGELVCVRPGISQPTLNVNTMTVSEAPLLVALFSSELSEIEARDLIEARPLGGWDDIGAFLLEPAISRIATAARNDAAVSIASDWLAADVDIGTGDLATSYQALYGREQDGEITLVSLVRRDF